MSIDLLLYVATITVRLILNASEHLPTPQHHWNFTDKKPPLDLAMTHVTLVGGPVAVAGGPRQTVAVLHQTQLPPRTRCLHHPATVRLRQGAHIACAVWGSPSVGGAGFWPLLAAATLRRIRTAPLPQAVAAGPADVGRLYCGHARRPSGRPMLQARPAAAPASGSLAST